MYINATGYYIPTERVSNDHFFEINGLTSDWILQRTGINTRSKAGEGENSDTMGLEAIRVAIPHLPYDIKDVDLIVSACYSPRDTVATLAHVAQREFKIEKAKALYISSASVMHLRLLRAILPWEKQPKLWLFVQSIILIIAMKVIPNADIYGVMPQSLFLFLKICRKKAKQR